jgi:GTP-binding protein YchF
MKIGIVGPPQSGKTTIFNAAAGAAEAVGDYSQASHRAIVKVPDSRLERLAELSKPRKVTHAEIDYLDSAAMSGKGKETDKAAINIPDDLRYADAIMVVLDCFSPDADPRKQLGLLTEEIILADQMIIERKLEKVERAAKLAADKGAAQEVDVLQKCLKALEGETPLAMAGLSDDEKQQVKGYTFLSLKPLLIVLNIAETDIGSEEKWLAAFQGLAEPGVRDCVALCGKIEMELVQLEDEDREPFLAELGLPGPAMEVLIRRSYALLGLISFFTTGDPEARAWTIREGTTARRAAGVVHSDMERGFIRAEVIAFEDYDQYESQHAAKEAGKLRVEGKEYVVRDGDVILFRFNV